MTPLALLLALSAAPAPITSVPQPGVARWSGVAAKTCAIHGKRYPAADATCDDPSDRRARAGRHAMRSTIRTDATRRSPTGTVASAGGREGGAGR